MTEREWQKERDWEIWDKNHSDRLAQSWGHPNLKRGYRGAITRRVSKYITGNTIADAGCGHGHLLPFVIEKLSTPDTKRVSYYGFDSSPEMIEKAREFFPEYKTLFVVGDALYPSFPPSDTVAAVDLIIHLPTELQFGAIRSLWALTKETFIFTIKLAKKHSVARQRAHKFSCEGVAKGYPTPKGKYLIIQWNTLEEVEGWLEQLDGVREVIRERYDARTEIFVLRR